MKPFPTDKKDRAQLWAEAQLLLPGLTALVTTLKDQNITFKVVRLDTGEEVYADEPDPDPSSIFHLDDRWQENYDLKVREATAVDLEAQRKEKKRIEGNKRRLKK